MKYLHSVGNGSFWLDHKLVPEVQGMLAAMSSRAPVGGVKARYEQIVHTVAVDMETSLEGSSKHPENFYDLAEDRLCEYPLHPKVQKFFDDFVGAYGHSSIMELVGGVSVFSERVSWITNWLLFDSPLCAGQEFSTRAVQHKDWPMARECEAQSILESLHNDWFSIFEAEVAWWKEHLTDPTNRAALGIGDKEPFRPALDRARWALPGTIATGSAHTSSIRERARVLRDGSLLSQASGAEASIAIWNEISETYRQALPGLAGMGLREAVYTPDSTIPGHLKSILSDTEDGPDVEISAGYMDGLSDVIPSKRSSEKAYLDPSANALYRVNVTLRCSLAVARDWHRHRTLYPWHLQVIRDSNGSLMIDPHYQPMSIIGKQLLPNLLKRSTETFDVYMAAGNVMQAALALPLGARVRLRGQGGLRDVVYILELRQNAVGANFEYKEQATTGLRLLHTELSGSCVEDETISDRFGF